MKRILEMLMAALAAGVAAVLVWALPLGEDVCSDDYNCRALVVTVLFFAFLFFLPIAGVLQWFAWRMEDSWALRAQTVRRAAALCPKILKAFYTLCAALALTFLFESGEAAFGGAFIMLYLTFPVGFLVMGVMVVLEETAKSFHIPTSSPDSMAGIVAWLALFAAGWWQWFIEVPTLWRRWRAERY